MARSHLLGKTAIVTGSSSGIGRSIALAFAAEGATLVVCADIKPSLAPLHAQSSSTQDSQLTAKQDADDDTVPTHELISRRWEPGKATYVRCDVSLEKGDEDGNIFTIEYTIAEAVARTGRLDIMVNNAGIDIVDIPLHETPFDGWKKCFAVHSDGTFLGTKHAIRQFLKQDVDEDNQRGCIINMSSIGGLTGFPLCSAYCCAKSSIIALGRVTASEYATRGIRCNVLCPGYIATPMLSRIIEASEGLAEFDSSAPVGHVGQPKDVANAAVWLASGKESGYVTGISLPVDGGFMSSGASSRLRQYIETK